MILRFISKLLNNGDEIPAPVIFKTNTISENMRKTHITDRSEENIYD